MENLEKISDNSKNEDDPYAYLKRSDFTSENFKIEIKNLPKIYGMNELRKLLNVRLKLNAKKIKTPRRNSIYAFTCFSNEEERLKALEIINGFKWKGKELKAIKAKPSPDPLVKKRNETMDDPNNKNITIDKINQEEQLKNSTIPLWNIPYKEQLDLKQNENKEFLNNFIENLCDINSELDKWKEQQLFQNEDVIYNLDKIRFVDDTDGYRNKCTFTIGINDETQLPTIGFRIGSYVNGITGVAPIDNLCHIPKSMKIIVKIFENFIRENKNNLEVYNFEIQTGHYRQLMLRVNQDNEVMVVVGIHPQNLSEDTLKIFKDSLIEFFNNFKDDSVRITSLYYQPIKKKVTGDDNHNSEHLWGSTHICEKLLDLNFKISPESFFQINTKGAELLYKAIIELALPADNSTILDVCCGTGTIGLCLSKYFPKIVGIELISQAIVDAKENAKLNNIENSEFFTGKAEDLLNVVCNRIEGDIIAIVDPPRAGLQQRAIKQLRKIKKIKKIIYVSCNPTAAKTNFIDLGRSPSKTLHNEPFVPIKSIPVDMFPHTKHCELVLCFKRFVE